MIHPTAVVSSKSHISQNVKVGPYCIIDDNVYIEQNTELISFGESILKIFIDYLINF